MTRLIRGVTVAWVNAIYWYGPQSRKGAEMNTVPVELRVSASPRLVAR